MRNLLIIVILALLAQSCTDDTPAPLPTSGGAIDELMFVVDDAHVEKAVSDSILFHFFQPYPGLPQLYEPMFPVKIRAWKRYKQSSTLFNKYRHIVFATALNEESEVNLLVQQAIGEENFQRAYTDSTFFYTTEHNKWARPQLVVYMFAPTWEELFRRVEANMHQFAAEVKAVENPRIGSTIYNMGKNPAISVRLEERFGITMDVPGDFSLYREHDSLVWFRKDMAFTDRHGDQSKQINRNILVAAVDMETYRTLMAKPDPLIARHGVATGPFKLIAHTMHYVVGQDSSYRMYMDTIRPLFQHHITLNGLDITENRGLWRMDMPFMGGAFLALTFPSPDGKRMITVLGTLYAAGSDKRTIIREFETMFATLQPVRHDTVAGHESNE